VSCYRPRRIRLAVGTADGSDISKRRVARRKSRPGTATLPNVLNTFGTPDDQVG
jgi:hypothetical protein